MKKYLPVLLAVACISPAQADTINLDLAGQVDMFHFSDRFIKNLQDCAPFTEQSSCDETGMKFDYEYQIQGWSGDKCQCEFISSSQVGHFVNRCTFDQEKLKAYVDALQDFLKKEKSSPDESENKNESLAAANKIISEACQMKVINVDYTQELRNNLKTCTPYEKTLNFSNMDNIMKVEGPDGDRCHYVYMIKNKPVALNKIYPEGVPESLKNLPQEGSVTTIDCLFTKEEVARYVDSLEKSMVKFGDNLDWNSGDSEITNRTLQPFIASGSCVYLTDFDKFKLYPPQGLPGHDQ